MLTKLLLLITDKLNLWALGLFTNLPMILPNKRKSAFHKQELLCLLQFLYSPVYPLFPEILFQSCKLTTPTYLLFSPSPLYHFILPFPSNIGTYT